MASILERGPGQFQVRWRPSSRERGQSCTLATRPLAEHATRIAEAHQHRITGRDVRVAALNLSGAKSPAAALPTGRRPPRASVPSVADWVEDFIGRKKGVQADVLHGYRRLLDAEVIPVLGYLRLDAVTRQHVARWVHALQDRPLKPATVKRYHAVLHHLFAVAVGVHLTDNPCDPAPGQRGNGLARIEQFEAVFLTTHEANLVVDASPPEIRDMVLVALGTGMRIGELTAVQRRDITLDTSQPVIRVRRARKADRTIGTPKSVRANRTITLPATLVPVLRRILDRPGRPIDLAFPNPAGRIWDASQFRRRYWLPTVARAQQCPNHPPTVGYDQHGRPKTERLAVSDCACPDRLHQPLRFHDLRHTHVGNLIEANWDLYAIQLRIGHQSIITTIDVYGHLRPTGSTTPLAALDVLLPGTTQAATTHQRSQWRQDRRRVHRHLTGRPETDAA